MAKYRYTITFDTDEDFARLEYDECLRRDLLDLAGDYYTENYKVKMEDNYCIKENNNIKSPFPLHVTDFVDYAGMGEYAERHELVDNNGKIICYSDYLTENDIKHLNKYIEEFLK